MPTFTDRYDLHYHQQQDSDLIMMGLMAMMMTMMMLMIMMMMIMKVMLMMMMILTSPSIMNPIPSLFFLNSVLALTGFWSKFFSKLNYSVTRRQNGWLEAYDFLHMKFFKSGQFNDENAADMIGIVFQNLVPRQRAFCLASFGASSAHLWKVKKS